MAALFSDAWMKQLMDAWNGEPEVKDKLAEIGFGSVITCGFKNEDNPRGVFVVENGVCMRAGSWSPSDPARLRARVLQSGTACRYPSVLSITTARDSSTADRRH